MADKVPVEPVDALATRCCNAAGIGIQHRRKQKVTGEDLDSDSESEDEDAMAGVLELLVNS